ncbi:MAG: hypothetical protein FRX49_00705 [Trebouxia sp. A1-2]|nr:MAG: hypothetical protein FRX49_00705 [Trebouxia sp. A1-2]
MHGAASDLVKSHIRTIQTSSDKKVVLYRAMNVTPDPKCSDAVLVKAAVTTSFCRGRNAVLSAEKTVQQLCFRQVVDIISDDDFGSDSLV